MQLEYPEDREKVELEELRPGDMCIHNGELLTILGQRRGNYEVTSQTLGEGPVMSGDIMVIPVKPEEVKVVIEEE